jgi:MFS family permease
MRRDRGDGPLWVWAVLYGAVFAIFETAVGLLGDQRPLGVIVGAVVGGVIFGPLMGWFMRRAARRQRAALGAASRQQRRAITRAAVRGPVPTDPELRHAAAGYAAHLVQLNSGSRRAVGLAGCAMFVLLSIVAALAGGTLWVLLCGAFFAGVGLWSLWFPTWLRRRIDRFEAA